MSQRDYLVIDLEATCDDAKAVPRGQIEIIEIGAVRVNGETLEITDAFQTFVRPVRHPVLTAFCRSLTSITQAQVDAAPGFAAAIDALRRFMGADRPLFSSWGAYDKNQFRQDAHHHRVDLPFGADHLNLKQAFSDALGTTKRFGMDGALRRVGLPLVGTHHRGIDDARNIARLLPYCVQRVPIPAPPQGTG